MVQLLKGWLTWEYRPVLEHFIRWEPYSGPLTKVEHVYWQMSNPFREYHHDQLSIEKFDQLRVNYGLTKKEVSMFYRYFQNIGYWDYDPKFMCHLIGKDLVDKNLVVYLCDFTFSLKKEEMELAWFHGINICAVWRVGWRVGWRVIAKEALSGYDQFLEGLKRKMVVLRGLELLPEHWREAVEFLGLL